MATQKTSSVSNSKEFKTAKDVKALLKVREQLKSKTPAFRRVGLLRHPKLEDTWRKPKGRDSKMRERKRHTLVQVGYGSPRAVRDMHPRGLFEVMVHNIQGLNGIDPKTHAIRIGGTVGNRKRLEIIEAAKKMKIWILNPIAHKLEKKKTEEKKETKAENKTAETKTDAQKTAPAKPTTTNPSTTKKG